MRVQVNAWNSSGHRAQNCSSTQAFEYCERLARAHYENFPVGSLLIPGKLRKHFFSIYAFARTADDFADEGYDNDSLTESDRLAALDDWQRQLDDCYDGSADHPIFIALAETAAELQLPKGLFLDLLSAFRQDVVRRRYSSFDDLLDYCSRSANPVGRLILILFGYKDEKLHRLSDFICTGLQLTNFWQDVELDARKDRVYLPQDEMRQFGVTDEDLRERRFSGNYARLLEFQVDRTRRMFRRGHSLPGLVRGRLSIELRLTWLGGMRILEMIEEMGYDTLNSRPELTAPDKIRLMMKSLVTIKQSLPALPE
jgi:phytoene synthase